MLKSLISKGQPLAAISLEFISLTLKGISGHLD